LFFRYGLAFLLRPASDHDLLTSDLSSWGYKDESPHSALIIIEKGLQIRGEE
jgi:hypothetical protein